jgi:hypothetical protein
MNALDNSSKNYKALAKKLYRYKTWFNSGNAIWKYGWWTFELILPNLELIKK